MTHLPKALTPEAIAAIAQNTEKILEAVRGRPQAPASEPVPSAVPAPAHVEIAHCRTLCPPPGPECCCPQKIKFFVFGNAQVENHNSSCPNSPV